MMNIILQNVSKDVENKLKDFIQEIDKNINIINEEDFIFIHNKNIEKIKIKDINYINEENRRLTYHLTNKEIVQSKTLQNSFSKEIHPLDRVPYMSFAAQAILVNMLNIKSIDKRDSTIKFYNGEFIRIPKERLEKIYNLWMELYK